MPRGYDERMDRALEAAGDLIAPRSSELEMELARLTVSTRSAATERRRRSATVIAAGGLAVLFAGGAAAAAAAGLWNPWAEDPDGVFHYSLPSGATCEERVGDISVANPDVRTAIQEIFRTTDVVARADVGAFTARLRDDDGAVALAERWIDTGSTTLTSTEDVLAQMATSRAVLDVVMIELEKRGFDPEEPENLLSARGQAICDGGAL